MKIKSINNNNKFYEITKEWKSFQLSYLIKNKFEEENKEFNIADAFLYMSRRFGPGNQFIDRYKILAEWNFLITTDDNINIMLNIFITGSSVYLYSFVTEEYFDKFLDDFNKKHNIIKTNFDSYQNALDIECNKNELNKYIDMILNILNNFKKSVSIRDIYYNIFGEADAPETDKDYIEYYKENEEN